MSQERIKKDYPKTFTRNMERLQGLQPKLAEKIYDFVEGNGFPQPSVKETAAGLWCSSLGERPFFQPHLSGKTFIPRKKRERPRPVVLIYGAGFPPYLVQALRSIDKSVLAVIVFEPSLEILVHTLATSSIYDALPEFARISFAVEEERILLDEALHVNVSPLGTFPVTQSDIVEHTGERELYREKILSLFAEFRKALRISIEKLGNTAEDTLIGVRNICLNAPWIWHTPSLEALAKEYKGLPVVTVASGPSLEKNFRLLKGLEQRCLIISADTALPKLLKEGIVPHVVITLERPFRMYLDYFRPLYREYYEECKNILLIAEGVSPPQIVGRWPGALAVIGKSELPVDRWILQDAFDANVLYSGASVMHVALSFAVFCRASSLAMIGQDLAYSKDGASHSEGIVSLADEKVERSRMDSGYDVLDINGEMVRTSISWLKMLQIFEDVIPSAPFDVFDCTEGGAKIEGSKILAFSDYIKENIPEGEIINASPCVFFKEKQTEIVPSEKINAIRPQLEGLTLNVEELKDLLGEMEISMNKALSPGLHPGIRRSFALETAQKLDDFHKKNRAIAFVGQSYAYATGSAFAVSRFMEYQEELENWQNAWEELIESHRALLSFLTYWFAYVFRVADWYAEFSSNKDFFEEMHSCSEKESQELAHEFFGASENLQIESRDVPRVTSFLSRSDSLQHNWESSCIWKAALFLEQQRRFEQSSLLMSEAADSMEGKELPREEIGKFLFDYARIVAKEDLCHFPKYRKAIAILHQAKKYFPEGSPDIEALSIDIRGAYEQAIARYEKAFVIPQSDKDPIMGFWEVSMNVERFLANKRLDLALKEMWFGILTFADKMPTSHTVLPQFAWLLTIVPKTVHAQDELIKEASYDVLSSMKKNLVFLKKMGMPLPLDFVALLEKEGISFIPSSR